jgi:AcrR family transcriptional regulator
MPRTAASSSASPTAEPEMKDELRMKEACESSPLPSADAAPARRERKRDPARTREDILRAAQEEFASRGLSGARVDAIAARTRTTKRMIYYYFGSKKGLYEEVLARAYAGIREVESRIALEAADAREAMARLVGATFDYHHQHPEFVRLVMIENIHHGSYVRTARILRDRNIPAITSLARILEAGQRQGVFRRSVDPLDLHLMISALSFYRVSNFYTFSANFAIDLADPDITARHRSMVIAAILAFLESAPSEREDHAPAVSEASGRSG